MEAGGLGRGADCGNARIDRVRLAPVNGDLIGGPNGLAEVRDQLREQEAEEVIGFKLSLDGGQKLGRLGC